MRHRWLLASALCLVSVHACAQDTEVKVGTGIEKSELSGASDHFKVPAGTRIYAWTKVYGSAEARIAIVFSKEDKEVSRQELEVPRSPYRTNAYRTFRAGDGGAWTARVLSADGQELAKAEFKVEISQ